MSALRDFFTSVVLPNHKAIREELEAKLAKAKKASENSLKVKPPEPGSTGGDLDASYIWFTPRAVLVLENGKVSVAKFPGGEKGAVELNAGEKGTLVLGMRIVGKQDNKYIDEDFTQDFEVTWGIAADDSGALKIDPGEDKIKTHEGGTSYRLKDDLSIKEVERSSYVTLKAVMLGSADSEAVGGSVEFASGQVGREAGPRVIKQPFRIDIKVHVPKAPVPKVVPVKAVPAKIPVDLLEAPLILFEVEDQDTLSAGSIGPLQAWVKQVKNHEYLGAVIAKGDVPLEIQAFASTTGSAKYNKEETDRRLNSVKKILQDSMFFGSSALQFDEKSHGMEKAHDVGPANQFNRRVQIKIDNNKAMKAGESQGPG